LGRRLGVFGNRLLRRIFGPKQYKVREERRTLRNEKIYILSSLQMSLGNQINENEVGGSCGTHGRGQESVQSFGGEAHGKETTRKTEA
jgi:hypothetical protein